MSTTTIHPSTSTVARGRHASDDPRPIIDALRESLPRVEEYQRVAETAQAEAMGLRNRLREVEAERDALARENRALNRTLHGIQHHIDETNAAWRVAAENHARDQAEIADLRRRLTAALDGLDRVPRPRGWWQP